MKLLDVYLAMHGAPEKTAGKAATGAPESADAVLAKLASEAKSDDDKNVVKMAASYREVGIRLARETFVNEILGPADAEKAASVLENVLGAKLAEEGDEEKEEEKSEEKKELPAFMKKEEGEEKGEESEKKDEEKKEETEEKKEEEKDASADPVEAFFAEVEKAAAPAEKVAAEKTAEEKLAELKKEALRELVTKLVSKARGAAGAGKDKALAALKYLKAKGGEGYKVMGDVVKGHGKQMAAAGAAGPAGGSLATYLTTRNKK